MRNTIAKKLRKKAENETIGNSKAYTKKYYRGLKKSYLREKRAGNNPRFVKGAEE